MGHGLIPGYPPASHVEGKYAAWMAENGTSEASVVINNTQGVCKRALNCEMAIQAILPEGHKLHVYYPDVTTPTTLIGKRKNPVK
ncbi:DddA-like double-stranded DNA deaminase toxin [Streptomyces sp. NPDC001674]|uniref:DddA-like double-stranded DNA deaminase toxin n=1 Tax=Streptomyces sp. NPDC001674 TaxID=3154394 RepID=UPI0033302274